MNRNIMLIGMTLLCMACSQKHLQTASQEASSSVAKINRYFEDNVEQMLSFHDYYSNLATDKQKKVFSETSLALSKDKQHKLNRLRMATMLSIPTSYARDPAKAQPLLQELMNDASLGKDELAYAGMLYEFSLDFAKQQQKLKDVAKQTDASDLKYQALQKKYDTLEQKHHALEHKLNELKNIEKSINAR
jgi:hypothetical protein